MSPVSISIAASPALIAAIEAAGVTLVLRGAELLASDPELAEQIAATWTPAAPERRLVPLALVLWRVEVLGATPALQAAIAADQATRQLLLKLEEGIYSDDAQARALLAGVGADPDLVLA
jgi:hypothetical protein